VQVEVLNKTVSYHTTIMTTLFELLIGTKPWLPFFPNQEIQKIH
jgi:hypothetical protein